MSVKKTVLPDLVIGQGKTQDRFKPVGVIEVMAMNVIKNGYVELAIFTDARSSIANVPHDLCGQGG